jgi:uncharacterized membrane protein affecting hemolysin expression
MRYVGTLTPELLRKMGHQNKSAEELAKLAEVLNRQEIVLMNHFLQSFSQSRKV